MIQRDAVTRQLLEDIRQRCLEGSSPTWEIGALRDHHASTSSMHELLAMLAELMQSLQQRGEYYAARTLLDAISHTLHEYLQAHERLELLLLQAALARDLSQTRKAGDTFAQVIVAAEALEYHELAARAHLGMCLMNESQVDPGRGNVSRPSGLPDGQTLQSHRMARRSHEPDSAVPPSTGARGQRWSPGWKAVALVAADGPSSCCTGGPAS